MGITCVIPFKNEFPEIGAVIENLLKTSSPNTIEIIVVNDGSVHGSGKFRSLEIDNPCVRVINNHIGFGVGYSFDRGVENCTSEIIVLMGADVFPKEGWYRKVIDAVQNNPNSIGCSVCVGNEPPYNKHYGANLLITMDNDDLPKNSGLRNRKGGYTDIFRGRWASKKSDEPYEISCLMGAMYWTSKSFYQLIHGWDTIPNNMYHGHAQWGHLEAFISLKAYLYGGNLMLYPDIETTHVFGRRDIFHQFIKGARSAKWMWWSALWCLETMVLKESTRNKIYDFIHPELNFNVALKMIKQNYKTIERVRERNRLEFKCSLDEIIDKFNIKI